MYLNFFGFHKKPFSLTPDPEFFFPSKSHRQGIAHLRYGIKERMGFVALSGEVGTGKTHLLRMLLQELGDDIKRALILNPVLNPDDLLVAILQDLEIPFDPSMGLRERLEVFVDYLLKEHSKGHRVLIIVDESHNLSIQSLERLRLLSNLETAGEKLVQVILVGQPELDLILKLPPLRSLNQRINVRHHLEPLNAAETELFIRHRLVVAGGQGVEAEFTRSASRLIYKASKGTPRVISTLCDYCLVIAFTEESHAITRKVAREAIRLHRSKEVVSAPRRMESRYKKRALIPALAGALALLVGLGLTGWNLYGSSGATSGKPSGKGGIVSASFLANPAPSVVVDSPDPIIEEAITEPAAAAVPTAQVAVAAPSPQPTAAGQSSAITSSFLMIEEDQPAAAIPAPPQPKIQETIPVPSVMPAQITGAALAALPAAPPEEPPAPLPSAPVKKAPEKKAAATGKVFSVQVASVKSKEKAESAARQFEPLGEVYIIPTTSGKTKGWYKILVGTFSSYQEALAVARQMNHVGMTKDALAVENHTPEAAADHPGADVNLVDAGSGLKTF